MNYILFRNTEYSSGTALDRYINSFDTIEAMNEFIKQDDIEQVKYYEYLDVKNNKTYYFETSGRPDLEVKSLYYDGLISREQLEKLQEFLAKLIEGDINIQWKEYETAE